MTKNRNFDELGVNQGFVGGKINYMGLLYTYQIQVKYYLSLKIRFWFLILSCQKFGHMGKMKKRYFYQMCSNYFSKQF